MIFPINPITGQRHQQKRKQPVVQWIIAAMVMFALYKQWDHAQMHERWDKAQIQMRDEHRASTEITTVLLPSEFK